MHTSKFALALICVFFAFSTTAHALNFSMSPDCIRKLSRGENRLNEKLPVVGLKKLANGMKEHSKDLQEDAVALLVDYSRSSKEKRAFFVDFKSCDILTADYAAHGGAYYDKKRKAHFDGDANVDGMLDKCKNKKGTRTNMTRPGLYVTKGCHVNTKKDWTILEDNCTGIKLMGLDKTNDDAFRSGVVLHELTSLKNNDSIKIMGQGCPVFPKGKLKSLLRYGIMKDTLVYVHAPQCS